MPTSDWRYTVALVSGGHFFSHLYILTLPPLFPFMRAEFGWGPTELGIVISALSIGGLLQPAVGGAVDKVGAKRLLLAGLVLAGTGLGLIGTAGSLAVVVVFAFLSGLGQSVFHPADFAIIDAVTADSTKGKSFGVHALAGALGFATAPVLVGTLGIWYGWREALYVVGTLGPLYTVLVWLTVEPAYLRQLDRGLANTTANSIRDSFRVFLRPATVILFAVFLVLTIANKNVQSFTGLFFLDALGFEEAVGNTALTAFFAASSVGIVVGGVLADRAAPRAVFAVSLSVVSVSLAVGVLLRTELVRPLAIALFALLGGCYGLVLPSRDRLVNAVAPRGSTGRTFGFVFAGISLGGVVGPASVGALIDATSVATGFLVVAAAFGSAVVFVSLLGTRLAPMSTGTAIPND